MEPASEALAVLVVEDEAMIRIVTAEGMEDAGFKVYAASNADQAVRLLEERADIKVLFTDVEMPGSMNGLELAHFARMLSPPVKIIVTSGRRRIEAVLLPDGGVFVDKPYRVDQIIEKMKRM